MSVTISRSAIDIVVRSRVPSPKCGKVDYKAIKQILSFKDENISVTDNLGLFNLAGFLNIINSVGKDSIEVTDILNFLCGKMHLNSALCIRKKNKNVNVEHILGNGFRLNRDRDYYKLAFACLGKVGEVISKQRAKISVKIFCNGNTITLHDVYSSIFVKKGDLVAVHYASVIYKFDDCSLYARYLPIQKKYLEVGVENKKSYEYSQWLGKSLYVFTRDRFKELRKA